MPPSFFILRTTKFNNLKKEKGMAEQLSLFPNFVLDRLEERHLMKKYNLCPFCEEQTLYTVGIWCVEDDGTEVPRVRCYQCHREYRG